MLARGRIKAGARFIQNEQTRFGHQCPADQHTLAFSLRQHQPWPFCQMRALDVMEQAERPPPTRGPTSRGRKLSSRTRLAVRLVCHGRTSRPWHNHGRGKECFTFVTLGNGTTGPHWEATTSSGPNGGVSCCTPGLAFASPPPSAPGAFTSSAGVG